MAWIFISWTTPVYAPHTLPAADLNRHESRHIMHSERLYVSHSQQRLLPQQCSLLPFRNHDLTTAGRIRPCLTSLLNKSSRYPTSFLLSTCLCTTWNELCQSWTSSVIITSVPSLQSHRSLHFGRYRKGKKKPLGGIESLSLWPTRFLYFIVEQTCLRRDEPNQ